MFARNKLIAVLVLVMVPVMACQAAWMRQEGEIAVSTGVTVSENGNVFDRSGTLFRNTCGGTVAAPIHVEYGASYYRTYYGNTSLTSYNCGAGQTTGFTDIELGMRGRMNLATNDHTWELAAIIPSYVSANGAARTPKNFGFKLGLYSTDSIDPYQTFLAGEMPSGNVVSYGAGVKAWVGHIPNELFGYVGWGHTISNAVWAENIGGWFFSARLDGKTSLGKEHTVTPGPLVQDMHDKFSLISGQVGLSHNLTQLSSVQFSLNQGLWGRNIGSPSSIHVGYSKVWRD